MQPHAALNLPPSRRDIPKALSRGFWPALVIPQLLVLAAIAAWTWRGMGPPGPRWMLVGLLPALAVVAGASIWKARGAAVRRLVLRTGGNVCLDCGYDLSASPDHAPCPECGRHHDAVLAKEAWRAAGLLPAGRS